MSIKIVMDSGKEYVTDEFESKEDFHSKLADLIKSSGGSIYTFMVISGGIAINVSHISSYEVID
ncbi:hypothetical protein [Bacillus subtilis]|uniref:hypothetical protein n=1 Tax=Bacillus subtilis TaxID=1423 RepID=UPI002DBDC76C|nr:hypothetical protein [Bacillus subtilis]MEC1273132.1 hypothetical protein [Bacillus subtilis]MEC1316139.1 hypothetical protein [Bacillus subtilis]MEC1496017.1 hypothetical protein [Bacillus subtilis]